ncbi:3-ketoacyl-ACP reductase [Chitinophaga alhagiae]|uniref:3-ketoacyl-ACP reductase n=1 Tax=Chitinophaga alhagiae TaxID=2203219 RepID=A0ABN5LNQ9_9BACT|nr:SDR family oxidoreductase [Chitinophaga alhagiae]AWO01005.1 3-ketoacyl-ACP reductase [Chitinophaga alhagiae]
MKETNDGRPEKKCLVTGGAGGLGTAICTTLCMAGYRVFMHDLPASPGAEVAAQINAAAGTERITFLPGDLADLDALRQRAARLQEEEGGIDVLVNNGGIDTIGELDGITLHEFQDTQTINSSAAFVLSQVLSAGMRQLGGGQIVNIMSIILSGGWNARVPYAMSKGSLLGLTRALARELGPYNIRVNAVSPGAIPTNMERKFWTDSREELDRFILDKQALKFRATPQDVADAVFFLVSDQSRFITGHELHVNGGWYMG